MAGPGHKPSFPTRPEILPRRAYERQVSGGQFEPLFGPTRPSAAVRERPLGGGPRLAETAYVGSAFTRMAWARRSATGDSRKTLDGLSNCATSVINRWTAGSSAARRVSAA